MIKQDKETPSHSEFTCEPTSVKKFYRVSYVYGSGYKFTGDTPKGVPNEIVAVHLVSEKLIFIGFLDSKGYIIEGSGIQESDLYIHIDPNKKEIYDLRLIKILAWIEEGPKTGEFIITKVKFLVPRMVN